MVRVAREAVGPDTQEGGPRWLLYPGSILAMSRRSTASGMGGLAGESVRLDSVSGVTLALPAMWMGVKANGRSFTRWFLILGLLIRSRAFVEKIGSKGLWSTARRN